MLIFGQKILEVASSTGLVPAPDIIGNASFQMQTIFQAIWKCDILCVNDLLMKINCQTMFCVSF